MPDDKTEAIESMTEFEKDEELLNDPEYVDAMIESLALECGDSDDVDDETDAILRQFNY